MFLRALLALALTSLTSTVGGQRSPADPTTSLVLRLEQAAAAADRPAMLALGMSPSSPGLSDFASNVELPPTRFIIKERDRAPLTTTTERLLLEVFVQYGNESAITTWRTDVTSEGLPPGERRIAEMEQLSVVSGLHRLALNPEKHFEVRSLTVQATDLTLTVPAGHAFVAEASGGPTAVVVLGRGRMRFTPSDPAERTQVRIFGGAEELATEFDALFLRVRPEDFAITFDAKALVPRPVGASELRRATAVFEDYIGQTLQLDLTDLSRERWSLIPSVGDVIAEVRTRRLGSLTYARSSRDPEDISLFDRRRRRNIAVYASAQKLASRGRFYSEDDLVEYDVQHYDLDVAFDPERLWVDGTARLRIRVKSYILNSLTLRLAEPLVVRQVFSPELGRLLHLRVVGQNSVIVNLPGGVTRDTVLSLDVVYGGRLEPQRIDREGITVVQQQRQNQEQDQVFIPIEAQYIYSNRSYWYPQATVTDYASARLRVAVPADYDVVASGTPAGPPAPAPGGVAQGERARKSFLYEAERPVRYLACVISRFTALEPREIALPGGLTLASPPAAAAPAANPSGRSGLIDIEAIAPAIRVSPKPGRLMLHVYANPRQTGRARSLSERAISILEYYSSIIGEAPYPSFTLAVTENELPGGHSPGYFAMLNHPPPTSLLFWRNDPVAFDNYPPFFLAHEIAHQWWGQGVGWKNYHEQWLSEGFAQYFAALYAQKDRGDETFEGMLRQMRRWSIEQSSQGPVYLGYRLGHIKADGRVFRAVVYNKGAMVLHMLRRLVGDEAFFAGIREFYAEWRFRKAGTDDFRRALERASGRDLESFFDGWIYGTDIPRLGFTSNVGGNQAQIRFEHRGEMIPVPVTISIGYSDGRTEEIVVPVTERVVERTLDLTGTVRSLEANRDHGAVATIERDDSAVSVRLRWVETATQGR
jgi:hypothetical protein